MNHCTFIGNLGAAPELRYTPNGNAVCNFRIAVNRSYTKDGQKHEEVEWVTIVAWDKLGEMCNQYLDKGRRVYVAGRLKTRKWEGKEGQKGVVVEIVAEKVLFLDKSDKAAEPVADAAVEEAPTEEPPF